MELALSLPLLFEGRKPMVTDQCFFCIRPGGTGGGADLSLGWTGEKGRSKRGNEGGELCS